MELKTTTPDGNKIAIYIYNHSYTFTDNVFTNKMCIMCREPEFPNINNKYYIPEKHEFGDNAGKSWFHADNLAKVIEFYDLYFKFKNVTPPTTLIQGL